MELDGGAKHCNYTFQILYVLKNIRLDAGQSVQRLQSIMQEIF